VSEPPKSELEFHGVVMVGCNLKDALSPLRWFELCSNSGIFFCHRWIQINADLSDLVTD